MRCLKKKMLTTDNGLNYIYIYIYIYCILHLYVINQSNGTNTFTNAKHWRKQADTNAGGLCCSGTNGFINFWLRYFDTRRETQFLLCLRYYADPNNAWHILGCLRSLSVEIRKKKQLHLQRPNPNFNSMAENSILYAPMKENSTICLWWSNVNSGLSLPGMTSFTLKPHFLSGVYYDNVDCHMFCARA